MPILFYTEGLSENKGDTPCSGEPRKWKETSVGELKQCTKRYQDATIRPDVPIDLRNKLIVSSKFSVKEVEMLIKQNPDAEYLQIFYGVDNEKHFHYMLPATAASKITVDNNAIVLEDCCRVPPNTSLDNFL